MSLPQPFSCAYIYRAKGIAFSIERVFEEVRSSMPDFIEQREVFCRVKKVRSAYGIPLNIFACSRQPCDVNHITGDIHYVAAGLPKKGLVLTIHDSGHINNLKGPTGWLFKHLWFHQPIKRAAVITFVSAYSKLEAEMLLGYPIKNGRVIPNPVPRGYSFQPRINDHPARILQIGTKSHKNIEMLAFALRGLAVELHVIGKLNESQLQVLGECGVKFFSKTNLSNEEVLLEYQLADIVVLISKHEGFGMPIIEAQAVGRPVIASNVCSIPEVAGDAAVLVSPHDMEEVRAGILSLMNSKDHRISLVDRGKENAKRFDLNRICRSYTDAYRDAMMAS